MTNGPPADKLPRWDETDLPALLTLAPAGDDRWSSRYGDANLNGRSYGGQTLGQAVMAASMGGPEGRHATMLQFLFLQGAMPDEPILFEVETLQAGRRFLSRHVRGSQGDGRAVLDAQVTFASTLESPQHQVRSTAIGEDPEGLPSLSDVPAAWEPRLKRLGGYSLQEKPSMDFRIPDLHRQVGPHDAQARLRFWLRARRPLPDTPGLHAAAFAYLSDWWLNFAGLATHVNHRGDARPLYISSLNHCIWFHRPFSPNEWMHFDCHSPGAAEGRALSIARVHDRAGRLIASATQECLMAYA